MLTLHSPASNCDVSILLAHVPEIFLQLHHKYNNTSQLARNLLTVCYCVMPYTQTGRLEIHTTNIMLPDHHNALENTIKYVLWAAAV